MIEREVALRAKAGLQDNTLSKVIIPEKDKGEANLPTTANARPCSQSNQEENDK